MNYHASRFKVDPKRAIVWEVFTAYLQDRFPMGNSVLELGCGYGDFINHCVAKEKFAVDLSPNMKSFLKPEVNFYAAELPASLPLEPESISTIFASNIFEHLSREAITKQIKEAHRLLKKDGLLMIFGPNYKKAYRDYFDDYTHLTPLTPVSLGDWLESEGFEITYSHPSLMPYSLKDSKLPVSRFLIKLWLFLPFKFLGAQMLVVGKKKK